ncbi:MAG: RimK family alpha-L-glutamate ligase [Candidatus Aenigmarchaeota archaeon]|nr:RimK family alpha-L-glutamate ligase [Candidatus Aenigmarchaeota archaeon]
MKFAVLGPREGEAGYSTKRILEEARKDFKNVKLIPAIDVRLKTDRKGLHAFHEKDALEGYEYILPRIDSKRAQVGYPIMRFLDHLGVRKPYVAETVIIAHNKFITLEQLAKHGIPIPETYLTSSRESANKVMEKMKLPAVIKLLSGFGGEGVLMIDSKEAFKSIIETMKILKQEMLIEKFIPNPGEDVRGIMAGDEIIASYKRIAPEGEKKANIHLGGRAVSYKLTPEMEEIVLKSGEAIKSRLCAIDMVVSKEGPQVIEVNINFGLKAIEKTTDINIARRIIEFVKDEMKR